MALQEKLDSLKARLESKAPAQTLEVMHRATEDLRRSGALDRALKAGDRAPDFTLPNMNGQQVSLREMLAGGPLVISFFRGKW